MDNPETGNIRLKTRNEEKQNNKHNLEKMSNTDLTKNQGVSPGACEVSAVPVSYKTCFLLSRFNLDQ